MIEEIDTAEAASFESNEMFDDIDFNANTEEPEVIEGDAPAEVAEVLEALQAPEYFESTHKDMFTKLQEVDGGRDYAQAWSDQYTKGQEYINGKLAESSNFKRDLDAYNQAFQPLQNQWAAQGLNPQMGAAQLAHYGQMLQNDPQALIKEIASTRNIDLEAFLGEQPYVDPEVNQLKQQLNGMMQQQQQQQQYSQQQQQLETNQTAQTAITEFANAKNDAGEALNPHLEKVQNTMAELLTIQNNGINDIKSAYDRAVMYDPEIQATIQASVKQDEAIQRSNEAKTAKTASSKTQSKTKDAPSVKLSWEDQIDKDVAEAWGN